MREAQDNVLSLRNGKKIPARGTNGHALTRRGNTWLPEEVAAPQREPPWFKAVIHAQTKTRNCNSPQLNNDRDRSKQFDGLQRHVPHGLATISFLERTYGKPRIPFCFRPFVLFSLFLLHARWIPCTHSAVATPPVTPAVSLGCYQDASGARIFSVKQTSSLTDMNAAVREKRGVFLDGGFAPVLGRILLFSDWFFKVSKISLFALLYLCSPLRQFAVRHVSCLRLVFFYLRRWCLCSPSTRLHPLHPWRKNRQQYCMAACDGQGFDYYGTQWRRECWCGSGTPEETYELYGGPLANSKCNLKCTGSSTERCGGTYTMSVYAF